MNANVDEGTKVGDVGHNTRQFHALFQVVNTLNAFGKLKLFNLLARVTSRFFKFFHDVGQRGQADIIAYIPTYIYARA